MQKKTKRNAFTLIELMIAIMVLGVIGIALTSLMIDSSKSMLWSVKKSMITNDFRDFTGQISQDAVNASHAFLYENFETSNVNAESDRKETGLSGDCLVLVSTAPFPTINSPRFYERIVVYYRNPDEDAERELLRTELEFASLTTPTTTPIETILTTRRSSFSTPKTVLNESRGLSGNQVFFRVTDKAFLINAEIIHGKNTQQITNTYNLTISTRG